MHVLNIHVLHWKMLPLKKKKKKIQPVHTSLSFTFHYSSRGHKNTKYIINFIVTENALLNEILNLNLRILKLQRKEYKTKESMPLWTMTGHLSQHLKHKNWTMVHNSVRICNTSILFLYIIYSCWLIICESLRQVHFVVRKELGPQKSGFLYRRMYLQTYISANEWNAICFPQLCVRGGGGIKNNENIQNARIFRDWKYRTNKMMLQNTKTEHQNLAYIHTNFSTWLAIQHLLWTGAGHGSACCNFLK